MEIRHGADFDDRSEARAGTFEGRAAATLVRP